MQILFISSRSEYKRNSKMQNLIVIKKRISKIIAKINKIVILLSKYK
jgi:hypothetical protein